MAAQLTAGVRQPRGIARRLRHHQQRDTLHAGAGDHDRAASHFALALVHPMQVSHPDGAVLVRDQHLPGHGIMEHRDAAALLGGDDVHVRRVVLGDDVAARHAVAAEVARRTRVHRHRERGLAHVHDPGAERGGGTFQNLVAALEWNRRKEGSVGQIFQAVAVAADTDLALDLLVVGRDVLVGDRPVLAGAVVGAPLEIALAEPERHGIPQHGLAADAAAALGIEAFLARAHRRNLPGGKLERQRVGVEVGPGIHAWTALDQRDAHALTREVRRERAAARTGADNDDVEDGGLHR